MDQNSTEYSPSARSTLAACRRLSVLAAFLFPIVLAGLTSFVWAQKKDSCVDCHSQMGGELSEPVAKSKNSIHLANGISCSDCHGGDPTSDDMQGAMNRAKGFIGKPTPQQIPDLCGKCHSNADFMKKFNPALRVDQEQEYLTSIHGKRLKSGDPKVATCSSCHTAHEVRAVKDPQAPVYPPNVAETCARCHANEDYMKGYNIPHDQYAKYKQSVHAKALYDKQDLSAPTCNSCHGNHGAVPPGVASVANVCGQCHVRQSDLFQASPHKTVFDAMQVGECIQCHGNHGIVAPSDQMLGVGPKSVCTSCHSEGDAGYDGASKMRKDIDSLSAGITGALDVLNQAELKGMEVSQPKFDLNDARDDLTNARVLIHSASFEQVDKVVKPGLAIADKSQHEGNAALAELSFRRKGLGVSLFFIIFLAVLIILKIRQSEGKQKA